MPQTVNLVSDPLLLLNLTTARLSSLTHRRTPQKLIICAARRRKPFPIARSGKLVLDSAFIVASKLRLLPEPLEVILRELGAGNGGGNIFWNRFGGGGSGGWNWGRKKLGIGGILVICGVVGLCLVMGKELVLDWNTLFGCLGLILLGFSVEGWGKGAKDWILGFCCCAFLAGFGLKSENVRNWVRNFGRSKKNGRIRVRVF